MSIYQTYRLQAKLFHGAITPWQADTLFGSFCWAYAYQYGDEALTKFLFAYKNDFPPLIISNGFPGDYLPSPFFTKISPWEVNMDKPKRLQQLRENKQLRKVTYLNPEEFMAFQRGQEVRFISKGHPVLKFDNFHNQINRLIDSTGEEGAFFHLHEWYTVTGIMSVYFKIQRGLEINVEEVLAIMGQRGIGKKHSLSRGAFQIEKFEVFDNFDRVDEGNSFISLSNFIPAEDDPVDGNYKTIVKYGKTDLGNNPFKSAVIMLQSGSVFKLNKEFKPFYGRMVENLAMDNRVYQYGLAFAVPAKIDWKNQ